MSIENPLLEKMLEESPELKGRKLVYPITLSHIVWRKLFSFLHNNLIYPAHVYFIDDAAEKASQLYRQGYNFLLLGTHPSPREASEIAARPAPYIPELFRAPITMPVTLNQYLVNQKKIDFFTEKAGVTAAPVVNRDAMEHLGLIWDFLGRDVQPGEALPQFRRLTQETFYRHGAVGIAPQGGRRTFLDLSQAKSKPIQTLHTSLRIKKDDKLALVLMAMTPLPKVNYEEIYDKDNRLPYEIVFWTLTLAEMYGMLDRINERLATEPVEPGKFKITLDELILIIFSLSVDPEYNKIPKGYALEVAIDYLWSI